MLPPCVDVDPDLFFPIAGEGTAAFVAQVEQARAVCERCVLRVECRDVAVERGYVGVWGGTTEGERRALKRVG